MKPDEVLEFWFGRQADDLAVAREKNTLWFGGDAAADDLIRKRFGELREHAVRGELVDWERSAQGSLGLILLVDQFSRNIHRGKPAAFQYDQLARGWARRLIGGGGYARLRPIQRLFVCLPLEHSENIADQQQSVALLEQLVRDVPKVQHRIFEEYADYARHHRDVVARYGRFPHRNKILGRESTAEEIEFLKLPNSSF